MTYDVNNKQQEMACQLIKDTNVSFFLTGKAGTGKTTFLHRSCPNRHRSHQCRR